MLLLLSALALAAWIGMAAAPGRFWRLEKDAPPSDIEDYPSVDVVIPARDEAPLIGETLASLWRQDYPGRLRVFLVDDASADGTGEAALAAARDMGRTSELQVTQGTPLPEGWTGKVWAMHQGVEASHASGGSEYVLFSDADISHGAESLRDLVRRAESDRLNLVSLMVRLRCQSLAEKLMIPAFVFFFRLLYPFRRVRNVHDPMAGAAGGTMLARRSAIERIGGLSAIRDQLIDDCALAKAVKADGHPIWLSLAQDSRSTRGYGGLGEIIRMISRTAYTQLGYSPVRLAISVAGLLFLFVTPPLLTLVAKDGASLIAASAWFLMSALYMPILLYCRRSPIWAPLLPVTACIYLYATLRSAWLHHHAKGGEWKGRVRSA